MILEAHGLKVHVRIWNEHYENSIVLLHGFTGSVSTWEVVVSHLSKFRVIAIDLIGHGKTESPVDVTKYSMEEQIELLEEVFDQLKLNHFTLMGYSMGGRVALSYVNAFPKRVQQLILESASPGLKTEEEREARRMADWTLANKIELNGIQSFVDKWENIPLFKSQKNLPIEVQQSVRAERLSQTEIGLANSLRGMGTGAQASLWSQLDDLRIPVTLVTGSLDEKFCIIAEQMTSTLHNGKHTVVKDVGHAIHVENPQQFATIVEEAIDLN